LNSGDPVGSKTFSIGDRIDQICERLKVKRSFIYDLTCRKQIPHIKVGRLLRFDPDEINNWLQSQRIIVKKREFRHRKRRCQEYLKEEQTGVLILK